MAILSFNLSNEPASGNDAGPSTEETIGKKKARNEDEVEINFDPRKMEERNAIVSEVLFGDHSLSAVFRLRALTFIFYLFTLFFPARVCISFARSSAAPRAASAKSADPEMELFACQI